MEGIIKFAPARNCILTRDLYGLLFVVCIYVCLDVPPKDASCISIIFLSLFQSIKELQGKKSLVLALIKKDPRVVVVVTRDLQGDRDVMEA